MKFEIHLTEKQLNFLAYTSPHNETPSLLPVREVKNYFLITDRTDLDSKDFTERVEALQKQSSKLIEGMKNISEGYELSRDRIILLGGIQNIFSKADWRRWQELERKREILEQQIKYLTNSRSSEIASIRRSLHGIVGIVQGNGIKHKYFYAGFVIPNENLEAVNNSIDTGIFSKDIHNQDSLILKFIFDGTRRIKGDTNYGHNPRFSAPSIAKRLNSMNLSQVRQGLLRLSGILCHAYGPIASPYTINGKKRSIYWDEWFIPQNNMTKVRGWI